MKSPNYIPTLILLALSLMIAVHFQGSILESEQEVTASSYILEEEVLEDLEKRSASRVLVLTDLDKIKLSVIHVSNLYDNVDPALVMSVIHYESRFDPRAVNGNCKGLMQVSTRWHYDRAARLGVEDFFDPYSNILLGVDYLSELTTRYEDPALVLMMYNMRHDTARELYSKGQITDYARSVLMLADTKYRDVVWALENL